MPEKTAGSTPVSLVSIFHHRGVNALAENQTLIFGPNLTVVYGDNAAGKTGYIRILKSACRARGQEQILGNVVSGAMPLSPVVSIKYKVGTEAEPREWAGNGEDEFISRVSVFDSQCAAVYLTEKTDVAFRPFGLDLFDKLVKACKAVRAKLESEQRALASNAWPPCRRRIPEGTAVAKLLANISSLTKPEAVQALARLSPEEEARLALLEKSLLDLQANDPEKLIRQLTLRAGAGPGARPPSQGRRSGALGAGRRRCVRCANRRPPQERGSRKTARGDLPGRHAGRNRFRVVDGALGGGPPILAGAGVSRPGRFRSCEDGAHCVLCQQDLDHAAGHRLQQFEAFVASTTERELRQVRETFARLRKSFTDLKTTTEAIDETLKEIRIEHEAVADAITAALATNENRRKAVVLALTEDKDLAADCPALVSVAREADALAEQIEARVKTLRTSATDETRKRITAEVQELRARKAARRA